MKKIFVIIVTYKGKFWYDRCFQSLRNSTYPVSTIVIDNASGDGSVDYIRQHYPEVMVIESDRNLGFGNANNVGMKYAREHDCDYVFLLNQDTWVEPDMMEKLVSAAEKHPEYGVYSPVHLSVDNKRINMQLQFPNPRSFISDAYCGTMQEVYDITYSNAAGWLIPRRTLETVGGFTPMIYHYGEDDDYMNRLKYFGMPMALVPAARMVHDSGKRLDNAEELSRYSNTYDPETFIDPRSSKSVLSMRAHYLFKALSRWLHGDKNGSESYMHHYQYLREHVKEIKYYRSCNTVKQPNWIQ